MHWCLLIALIGAMGLSGFLGLRSTLRTKSENDLNLYLAYRYLQTGDGLNASKKADLCAGDAKGHDQVVALLADAVQGDYIAAYFAATQIVESQQVDQSLMGSVEAVRNIASEILGISEGEGAKNELPLVGISLEGDDMAAVELSLIHIYFAAAIPAISGRNPKATFFTHDNRIARRVKMHSPRNTEVQDNAALQPAKGRRAFS